MSPSTTHAIRLRLIEALERRASDHEGEARGLLDEKRSALVEAFASDARTATTDGARGPGPLGQLVDPLVSPNSYPELPALEEFRKIWSGLRAENQLRQTLEYIPENAGPLNSSALVHRSIELMRELAPGYLRHFLSYVDDLSWVERMTAGGALADKHAPQAASIGKRARAKPRARR